MVKALPRNFLSRTGGQWLPIKSFDLAILLFHVHKGAQMQEVGFEDARESLESLTKKLNKTVFLNPTILESALWSANLMDEAGKFWHPQDLSFNDWVKRMLGSKEYSRIYSLIHSEGGNKNE